MKGIINRLKEPSTWAGLSALMFGFGVIDQQQAEIIIQAGSAVAQAADQPVANLGIIGGSISALIAAFVPERGKRG